LETHPAVINKTTNKKIPELILGFIFL